MRCVVRIRRPLCRRLPPERRSDNLHLYRKELSELSRMGGREESGYLDEAETKRH